MKQINLFACLGWKHLKGRVLFFLLLLITLTGITIGGAEDVLAKCQEWEAANYQHVEEGRAYTTRERLGCYTVTAYYAVGSNEPLGFSGNATVTLYSEDDGQTYLEGACPDIQDPLAPVNISAPIAPEQEIVDQQIAINDAGEAVVVWLERTIYTMETQSSRPLYKIWVNRFNGTSWGSPVMLAQRFTIFALASPLIALSDNGNAMVVWYDAKVNWVTGDIVTGIWSNHFNGSTWRDAVQITEIKNETIAPTNIAMDAAGNAMVLWYHVNETGETGRNLWVNSFNGSAWGTPVVLENGPVKVQKNQIGMDGNGNAIVVWYQESFEGQNSIQARRFDGSSWLPSEQISSNLGDYDSWDELALAINADGNACAYWRERVYIPDGSGNFTDIVMANHFDGMAWGSPEMMTDTLGNISTFNMNANGKAIVLFTRNSMTWSKQFDGTVWSESVSVGFDFYDFDRYPKVVMNADGKAVVAWYDEYTWAKRFDGVAWGDAQMISDESSSGPEGATSGGMTSYTPKDSQIAMNADGKAFVVWQYGKSLWANSVK